MAKNIKCIIIGPRCGKTSLLTRYMDNVFNSVEVTNGVDYRLKELTHAPIKSNNESKQLIYNTVNQICIWDSGSFEKYSGIIISYYRLCNCVIYCFALDNMHSFNSLLSVIYKMEHINYNFSHPSFAILVGTHNDLLSDENRTELLTYYNTKFNEISSKYNIAKFFQISSKVGYGVNEIFEYILKKNATDTNANKNILIESNPYSTIITHDKDISSEDKNKKDSCWSYLLECFYS